MLAGVSLGAERNLRWWQHGGKGQHQEFIGGVRDLVLDFLEQAGAK